MGIHPRQDWGGGGRGPGLTSCLGWEVVLAVLAVHPALLDQVEEAQSVPLLSQFHLIPRTMHWSSYRKGSEDSTPPASAIFRAEVTSRCSYKDMAAPPPPAWGPESTPAGGNSFNQELNVDWLGEILRVLSRAASVYDSGVQKNLGQRQDTLCSTPSPSWECRVCH